jgi:fructose-1,6-bisphosphatase
MTFANKEYRQQYFHKYYIDHKDTIKERKKRWYHERKEWLKIRKELPIGLIL